MQSSVPVFDPLSITWDQAHWASDPSWSAPANGAAVSSWRDGSGNSRPAVRETPSLQPLYRASVAALNNKPAVQFDGVDDSLTNTAAYTRAQPFTFVVIVSAWGDSPAGRLIGASGSGIQVIHGYSGAGAVDVYGGGGVVGGVSADTTNGHLYTFLFSGASSAIGKDGTITTLASSPGTASVTSGFTIGDIDGGGAPSACTVAFAALYNGDFAANANYGAFKTWVASYYGLTIS